LPAVTEPCCANTGLSFASASIDVSARGPSSRATSRAATFTSRACKSGVCSLIRYGVISSLNSPLSIAASARRWLS